MQDVAYSPDGIALHYDVHGAGAPALVFVHGWSCDRGYWSGQVDHFARRHTVVAIDLAGHGASGDGRQAWTMPAFGADVVAVVDRLRLTRIVLIGHSMGGDVIVEAARHLGDRVVGLVWVDTYSTLDEPRGRAEVLAFLAPFREDFVGSTRSFVRTMFLPGTDPELVDRIVADMSAAPPAIAFDALDHAMSNDQPIVEGLKDVVAPVVALNPEHSQTDVEGLRRHGVETVEMAGVGHFLMLEDAVTFNRLLEATIDGYGASFRGSR